MSQSGGVKRRGTKIINKQRPDPLRFPSTNNGLTPSGFPEVIEREVLSPHLLRNEIESIDFEDYIASFTRQMIHDKLGEKLRAIPVIGPFLNEATLSRLAAMAGQEMKKQAPYLKHRLSEEIEHRLPIRELIESRIRTFDVRKLEELVDGVAAREFRAIEYLGAVFGFVVGLLQLLLLLAVGYLQM